jgi:hypothetical protein
MADVPDDLIAGAVENAVQRHGQFDRAETGRQVAADLADTRQDDLADLVGEGLELGNSQ